MSAPVTKIDLLALRIAAGGGRVEHMAHYHFSFGPLASFVAVPPLVFDRLVGEGLVEASGAVTAKGREAARALIGGPQP